MNQDCASESATNTDLKLGDVLLAKTTTFDCNSYKNMAMLIGTDYTHINDSTNVNDLVPVTSKGGAVHDIDVKVENDLSVYQRIIKTEDKIDYDMVDRQTMSRLIAIDEIKVEFDAVNQDITKQENISTEYTTSDMLCESTTTRDFVTDDNEVENIQEIITPEEFTDNEMMCRSKLLSDDDNCDMMNQDGACESSTSSVVKVGDVLGEDYSSVSGLPLAETMHKVGLSDTAVQPVTKVPNETTRLAYNMTTQSGEKPFSCEICHKTFSQKRNFASHMRTHSRERPFTCEVCHKTFRRKSNLVTHTRIHSGEKPFTCEVCHKTLSHKCSLMRHLRTHSGEPWKPFTCEVCHKRFGQKNSLVSHLRKHSREKPFTCEVCHERFSRKSNLVIHTRIHSGVKPFTCEVCHKSLSHKCNLVRHLKLHSREKSVYV